MAVTRAPIRTSNRSVRLVQIVTAMREGQSFTASEISDRWDISVRTAERDILDIDLYLIPLLSKSTPDGERFRMFKG